MPKLLSCSEAPDETGGQQIRHQSSNDWADVETDRRNTTYNILSGGSRVIVDGPLARRTVGIAAFVMASLAISVALAVG